VGWSQFIAHLDADVQIALEVTGSAFEVYDILAPHAAQVLVSNPVAMRRLGSGRHTDREDAVRLAQMLALGTLPAVWVPPHPVRGVRRLLAVRERLGSYRRALTNQARAVLSRTLVRILVILGYFYSPPGAPISRKNLNPTPSEGLDFRSKSKPLEQGPEVPATQLAISQDLRGQARADDFARMHRDRRCPAIGMTEKMVAALRANYLEASGG
jgi:hypothetical protein